MTPPIFEFFRKACDSAEKLESAYSSYKELSEGLFC